MNGAIIPTNNICYKEVTIGVSPNGNIPPWTYYGNNVLGLNSGDKVIGLAVQCDGSSARPIVSYHSNGNIYAYSFTSGDVVVGVTYVRG